MSGQGAKGRARNHIKQQPSSAEWSERAACKNAVTAHFFSSTDLNGRYVDEMVTSVTKAYCNRCPVYQECFDWAVDSRTQGVCANTTTRDREFARSDKKAGAVVNPPKRPQ